MEENKMKVLFNRVIPENYDDLQNMFKEVFKQDNIKNLTFDDGKEKINITEENYKNYVISAIELSHTTKNILVNVDQKKEDDKLEIKFNENLDLLKRKIKENNELKKKNKELEQKIQKLNEEEEIRKKEINEEDKKDVMSELERKNEMINQKCKILDGFEEFKKYMQEDKKYLDNLNKVEKDYKEKFESEIKTILEEIKNKLINETRRKCEEEFNKYIEELEEAENKRKKEYDGGLESINYRMLIESSDLIHNIQCKQCEIKPIIGVLYKCECCRDYYLCEKCEDKNYHSNKHPHNFIKMRKSDKMIIDKEAINKNQDDKKDNQSQKNNENNQKSYNENNYNPYVKMNNYDNNQRDINYNKKKHDEKNIRDNKINNNNNQMKQKEDNKDEFNTQANYNILLPDDNQKGFLDSIVNQINNQGENNEREQFERRNQIVNQNKEIYNKNISLFSCELENNGIYIFDKSQRFRPEVSFIIKNISQKDWERDIYLKTNDNSQLKIEKYKLFSLKKDQYQTVTLKIPSINEISEGDYELLLDFYASNKRFGEPIKLLIRILPDINQLRIQEFRKQFDFSPKEFSDKFILDLLSKNNFNFEKAFNEYLKRFQN